MGQVGQLSYNFCSEKTGHVQLVLNHSVYTIELKYHKQGWKK